MQRKIGSLQICVMFQGQTNSPKYTEIIINISVIHTYFQQINCFQILDFHDCHRGNIELFIITSTPVQHLIERSYKIHTNVAGIYRLF